MTSVDTVLMQEYSRVKCFAYSVRHALPNCVSHDDLVQSGMVGLIEAARKFNPDRHAQLWSYAQHRVKGAMIDQMRVLDWAPRRLRRENRQIQECRHRLLLEFGREATHEELAQQLGISIQHLHNKLSEIGRARVQSLDCVPSPDAETTNVAESVPEIAAESDPFQECLARQHRALLSIAIAELPARQREVLTLYYYRQLGMQEIARRLGVGKARISQLHTEAIQLLKVLVQTKEARKRCCKAGRNSQPIQEKAAPQAGFVDGRATTFGMQKAAEHRSGQ